MKLQDKKTISSEKSIERKHEVEEGIKLAKSIDSLRETLAKEQENLRKFRDESLKSIKSEIGLLQDEKKEIADQVAQLKEERLKAQAPIDLTNEWNKVESLKQELQQRETNVISREILVQNLEKREKNVIEKEKEAEKYLEAARVSYTKTDGLRSEMERRKKESDETINDRIKSLDEKENNLLSRETLVGQQMSQVTKDKNDLLIKGTDLIERESKVESEQKSLAEREIKVRDQESLAKRYLDEAALNYDKSEDVKVETEKIKDEAKKDIHNRYISLTEREREIGYRERDLILEKEGVENDKKWIEKEKIHISSQQQTLKVAWENIKKLQK